MTRARERGYTLTELMVALSAGLIVAMALVGLSKEATTTFHEEARAAGAESAVRLALDRLRADLQRVSFMSTGNVRFDPWIAHRLDDANVPASYPAAMQRLAGLRYRPGGSAASTPLSAIQNPPLRPDQIEIAGNLTSTDAFPAREIAPAGTSACGGQRILLERDAPPIWRIVGAAGGAPGGPGLDPRLADQLLAAAFQPVPGAAFLVRVVDETGRAQFARTCATPPPWGAAGSANGAPFVDLDPSTPIERARTGFVGGITGFGRATVNPVQIVRWSVGPVTDPAYAALTPRPDPTKYDLTRQFLDANGAPVGTSEVIAELAVDFKVAFTVDAQPPASSPPPAPPSLGPLGQAPDLRVFPFDDPNNALWADDVTTHALSVPGPQRIRSVRVRLSTRAASADRTQSLAAPALGALSSPVLRYCTSLDGCDPGRPVWARVRTLVTEVALPNQERMFY